MSDLSDGWQEAALAWSVCASIHREYAKGRDPVYKTRQSDFVRHEKAARIKAFSAYIRSTKAMSVDEEQKAYRTELERLKKDRDYWMDKAR